MNKHFEELKEQCWVDKQWDKENERWIDRHIDLEKFAKLIVKKCIDLAVQEEERFAEFNPAEYNNLDTMDLAYAMENYQMLVKEHFGS